MADIVRGTGVLSFPWPTIDPFLFCAHHDDAYPRGNEAQAPAVSLAGRKLGMDFSQRDGFSMYHGETVPGFPQHPHRGFETITLVRKGLIDHSDSLGATARFGGGDVQWMTAGRGIQHAEMFPLVHEDADNPLELFQIWLNLPAADKMVDPYFTMLWADTIPVIEAKGSRVAVVAGSIGAVAGPRTPPNSWAARSESDIGVYTVTLDAGASVTLPPARPGTNRVVYFFEGRSAEVGGRALSSHTVVHVREDHPLTMTGGADGADMLVLQGRPIGEPVVHHGPFVMNTKAEIQQAIADYRATQFGAWPWPSPGPVHARSQERFAVHADGTRETTG